MATSTTQRWNRVREHYQELFRRPVAWKSKSEVVVSVLHRAARRFTQVKKAFFASAGVSDIEFQVMLAADHHENAGGVPQSHLAAALVADPKTVSALLKRMLAKQTITLEPMTGLDEDRRCKRVRLTRRRAGKGKAQLDRLAGEYYRVLPQLLRGIPDEDRLRFLETLERIEVNATALLGKLDEDRDSPTP